MIRFQEIPHLQLFSGLELDLTDKRVRETKKNISVHFSLSQESVSAYLLLDSHEFSHSQRMELLEVLSETMNIYLGKLLSQTKSEQELSVPRFLNIDQTVSFKDDMWNFFELLFNENIYSVAVSTERKQ